MYGEFDFMRRSIEAFKERLCEAKVESQSIVVKGEGHCFFYLVKLKGVSIDPYPSELIP
jgi:acetyl esterase/lipase